MRHADKQDSFKTFNIFFPLQMMITRLLKQMMVLVRVRMRSLMKLQGGYMLQRKLKSQLRLSLRTLMMMTMRIMRRMMRKMVRKLMRRLLRRLKTLSGTRKQLFRYLYTETYERDFLDLLCTLFLKRDLKFNLFYCFSDCCHEVASTYNFFY